MLGHLDTLSRLSQPFALQYIDLVLWFDSFETKNRMYRTLAKHHTHYTTGCLSVIINLINNTSLT